MGSPGTGWMGRESGAASPSPAPPKGGPVMTYAPMGASLWDGTEEEPERGSDLLQSGHAQRPVATTRALMETWIRLVGPGHLVI